MWGAASPGQAESVVALVRRVKKDAVLVAECGTRVACHALLLALHSPLLAHLLVEGEGVSLPLALPTVAALVALVEGEVGEVAGEVQEAAAWLGISWQGGVKVERRQSTESGGEKVEEVKVEEHKIVDEEEEMLSDGGNEDEGDLDYSDPIDHVEGDKDEDSDFDGSNAEDDDYEPEKSTPKKARGPGRPSIGGGVVKKMRRNRELMNKFVCDVCDEKYATHFLLVKHKLVKHDVPMTCESCGEEIQGDSRQEYKKHLRLNHKDFVCTFCGASKASKSALHQHIESHHKENVPCPHCGLMLATQQNLSLHIRKMHEGVYEHCSKCDYKSKHPENLRFHYQRRHTDELHVACEFCGKIFKDLKGHMARTGCGGNGERRNLNIKCSECDKTFVSRQKMVEHVKRIHRGVKDKVCSHCSYATYTNFNLRLHVSKVHLEGSMVKETCRFCQEETTNMEHHIHIYHSKHSTIAPYSYLPK